MGRSEIRSERRPFSPIPRPAIAGARPSDFRFSHFDFPPLTE